MPRQQMSARCARRSGSPPRNTRLRSPLMTIGAEHMNSCSPDSTEAANFLRDPRPSSCPWPHPLANRRGGQGSDQRCERVVDRRVPFAYPADWLDLSCHRKSTFIGCGWNMRSQTAPVRSQSGSTRCRSVSKPVSFEKRAHDQGLVGLAGIACHVIRVCACRAGQLHLALAAQGKPKMHGRTAG